MSKRKELLATGATFLRIVNETDEVEAENTTAKRSLEATRAEHVEEKARLERTKAAIVEAEIAHQRWREVSAAERTKTNSEIDRLQEELRKLEAAVAERRAEHNNIIAGISALHARLKV